MKYSTFKKLFDEPFTKNLKSEYVLQSIFTVESLAKFLLSIYESVEDIENTKVYYEDVNKISGRKWYTLNEIANNNTDEHFAKIKKQDVLYWAAEDDPYKAPTPN